MPAFSGALGVNGIRPGIFFKGFFRGGADFKEGVFDSNVDHGIALFFHFIGGEQHKLRYGGEAREEAWTTVLEALDALLD